MALKNGTDHRHSRQTSPDYAGHVPKHDLLRERLNEILGGNDVKISAALCVANRQTTDFGEFLTGDDVTRVKRVFNDLRIPLPKT